MALSVYRASDVRPRGRGFESRPGSRRKKTLGKFLTPYYVPLSPSSISWYWPGWFGWLVDIFRLDDSWTPVPDAVELYGNR